METSFKEEGFGQDCSDGLTWYGSCLVTQRLKSQPVTGCPRHGGADDDSTAPGEKRQRDKLDGLGASAHFLCDLGKSLLSGLQLLIYGARGLGYAML